MWVGVQRRPVSCKEGNLNLISGFNFINVTFFIIIFLILTLSSLPQLIISDVLAPGVISFNLDLFILVHQENSQMTVAQFQMNPLVHAMRQLPETGW